MPNKYDRMNITNREEDDRRVKLTQEDKDRIKAIYNNGNGPAIRQITRDFGVSRRLIQFILFPERLEAARANRDWRKYYTKEKHRAYMRKHRIHMKELYQAGKLKEANETN